ncbi:GNAT family N-acetyltransferase [Cellulomonas telluris]|uniref:GNAT family N-acetyltransferase n=1 Tax=Cellulomonas telluris TaxID=2306636 RepID=UPI0010A77185|nr:GNAT family N-acetyltransferase [Cellulomonas telluris]
MDGTTTTTFALHELPLVLTREDPEAWLLVGMVRARNAVIRADWGHDDFGGTEQETFSDLQHQRYTRRRRVVAVVDGADGDPDRVVGYARLDLPLQENTHTGYADVGVRPEHRGRGIGAALHAAAVELARGDGRTKLVAETDHAVEPPEGPGALSAPTGSGRVPADAPSVRFAQGHGWRLEQVVRHSRLHLPVPADVLETHRAAALERAGADYRLVQWQDACPDAWVEQFALLNTRMSTDVPLGGLDFEEDRWDAERVRRVEEQVLARGEHLLTSAVEHVPTGTLVAFSSFQVPGHSDEFVWQGDTLVLKEHRGRRLGMLVKIAQLDLLARALPSVRRISTWNAEENSWMLAINAALGFRPEGCVGEWQREL